ncbi:MAG: type II toxin-antitoxin system VapC family toxin [Anaerolineae bacterium]|nr:type II toxin-antitoxin system VapC family toxin [Anaerolineae bacterium]
MTDYLLDTNHASPLVTLGHPLRQRVLSLQANHSFAIAVPVLAEVLYGLHLLPRAEQNLVEWARLRLNFNCYASDEFDAEQAVELQIKLRRRGWQLATIDALVAAVALRYDLTLLTTDKDFSAIPQLQQENWLIL